MTNTVRGGVVRHATLKAAILDMAVTARRVGIMTLPPHNKEAVWDRI
jgi:hypothetical protein